jgi:VWFA-related protein
VRYLIRRAALVIALAGAANVWATAQSAQEPAQDRPRIRVESNFVRVDAYPIRDGKPLVNLKAEDFEVYEDGTLQKIETFEHVIVRPAGPQEERIDPGSQRAALGAAANPRNRVFVIFLDLPHVMISSAHDINEPLIRLMDRILGPDDLIAVMTPDMAANQIVFARKTQVIETGLRKNWAWGKRFTFERDDREHSYNQCYPPLSTEKGGESALAKELIRRKRERQTLDALRDLVQYLREVREERKAIITVTEGWLLFQPNDEITRLRKDKLTGREEPVPTLDPVTVGPNGKLTTKDERRTSGSLSYGECDGDRIMLAQMDNKRYFRDILDDANRANASFYPIDPRGLPAGDNPIGPDPPPPIDVDRAMLKERLENLRTLALVTDGLAVLDNNDLDRGLKRISDDLTSYYLLGYYSTNAKNDGRFRSIRVRVKQPGVDVRARRGYKAATEEEVASRRRAEDAPVPEIVSATTAAIQRLGRNRSDLRFRVNASAAPGGKLWVAGELLPQAGPDPFANGATVSIEAISGGKSSTAKAVLKAGERSFLLPIDLHSQASEAVDVRARASATDATSTLSDSIPVDLTGRIRQPLLFRRGVTTGNRQMPAADFRFSRTERAHLEIPVGADVKPGTGRLLDRAGQPLQIPVTVGERTDADSGQRWITADISLAALSAGDYAIEVVLLGTPEERVVTGLRVTR